MGVATYGRLTDIDGAAGRLDVCVAECDGRETPMSMARQANRIGMMRERAGLVVNWCAMELLEPRQLMVFDPTPNEQYLMELLNRMRTHPAEELGLLTSSLGNPARSSNPDVDSALRYFHTSGTVLASQWASLTAAQPLAWSDKLYQSAEGHNAAMIAADAQTHQAPGEPDLGARATNAGYTNWTQVAENIYAFAEGVVHTHAGFALDWGGDRNDPNTTGIQNPPGHRDDMMEPTYREVGIRIATPGNVVGRSVGPWVVTQDFGRRFNSGNPFLLGVAYQDGGSDGYSPGEGFGGVTIHAVAANGSAGAPEYSVTSMSAGGWQMQVPVGTYAVTFSGGGWGSAVTYYNVTVGSQNAKLDGVRGIAPPAPVIQVSGNGLVVSSGDTSPRRQDDTDFGNANLTQQSVTKTFTIGNSGNQNLRLTSFTHVIISGVNASDFTLVSDAATNVAAGTSTTFTITFDPSVLGVRNATITITSNDPTTATYSFSILGRGVNRPIMQVSGNQMVVAQADDTPTTADWTSFAGVNTQYGSKVRVYTITNVGLATMTLGATGTPAVQITGANADLFTVFLLPAATLAPGATTQFRVRFTPGGIIGFAYASVTITSNDTITPSETFSIRGTGLAQPRLELSGAGVVIAPGDSTPSTLDRTDFGRVSTAGTANRVRLFTIRNTGLADLVLSGTSFVTIAGLNAADYFISAQPPGGVLTVGQSVTFKVRFDPLSLGARSAVIRIVTNDPLVAGVGGVFSFVVGGVGV